MGIAASISSLVTALFGLYLLAFWLIKNDVMHRGRAASRLPEPVIAEVCAARHDRGGLGDPPGVRS